MTITNVNCVISLQSIRMMTLFVSIGSVRAMLKNNNKYLNKVAMVIITHITDKTVPIAI